MPGLSVIGVQIPNNQALSGELELGTFSKIAIELPSTWPAGVTTMTFQGKSSRAGSEQVQNPEEQWKNLYEDAGNEVSITVGANRIVGIGTAVKLAALAGMRFLRLRTGTSAAPVNVSPLQQIKVIVKSE